MTRKHFQAIADALREERNASRNNAATRAAVDRIARRLADVCKGLNSRFNRERFLTACREV